MRRVKSTAHLKVLWAVENFDCPTGSDKNKNKYKYKYNNKGKEKEKHNGAAFAADTASCCGKRVFDCFCSDDPALAEVLRNHVGARQSICETVSEADAEKPYRKLLTCPAEQCRVKPCSVGRVTGAAAAATEAPAPHGAAIPEKIPCKNR